MSPKMLMVWRGVDWYVIETVRSRWSQVVCLGPACRTNLGQCFGWWTRPDLNREPTDYESAALTIELRVLDSHRSTRSLIHRAGKSEQRKPKRNETSATSTHRNPTTRSVPPG